MADPDPFGRAILDFHRGEQTEPLFDRDGTDTRDHPIESFYFTEFDPERTENADWLADKLDGPLLDLGAGAGRHALYFQEQFETVTIEPSEHLVTLMAEREVEDARQGDMFALREQFDRDRFESALAIGTQVGLAGSMDGLRQFLGDLAYVTTPDATAVVDSYDPTLERTTEQLGYRDDPTPDLAYRVLHFEYEGDVGPTLLFRLFSPDRLRQATTGTGWRVSEVRHHPPEDPCQYRAVIEKR